MLLELQEQIDASPILALGLMRLSQQVHISEPDMGQPCLFGGCQTALRQASIGQWKVRHVKLRMKSQHVVWNTPIQPCNEAGDGRDLIFVADC